MTYRIQIKPFIMRENWRGKPYQHKDELLYALRNNNIVNRGDHFVKLSNTHISPNIPVGINFEKHRKKVQFVKFKTGKNQGRVKETKIVKAGGWVAYVYVFNQVPNIKIKQHARHFEIL